MSTCKTSQTAVSQALDGRSKRQWSRSEDTATASRSKAHHKRLELAREQGKTPEQAKLLAELQRTQKVQDLYQSTHLDALVKLDPTEFSRQENTLARLLGIHKRKMGISDTLTQAGEVKLQIVDLLDSGANLIELMGKYAFKQQTGKGLNTIRELLKQKGIHKAEGIDEFINFVGEVSQSGRQRVAYGNNSAVNLVLSKRYNDMMTDAKKFGLSNQDMDVIVDSLRVAMESTDNTHALARQMGVEMGSTFDVNYFKREFTDKAEAFFKLRSDKGNWIQDGLSKSSVQHSRETWSLVTSDYEVLAQYLTPGKYTQWNDTVKELTGKSYNSFLGESGTDLDALTEISKVTGKSLDELKALRFSQVEDIVLDLHKLADDGQALTKHLHDKLTASQMDELVDAGVLHKVEMTTRDVVDYIARQYELPYQKASGMFEYDIAKRIDNYVTSLKKSAGEANLIKNLATRGVDSGWAVPSVMLTSEHANFVKLSGVDVTKYGISKDIAKDWEGLFVHPTVANQLEAYLELSTNPGKLSQFANIWSTVLKNFNMGTLAGNGLGYLSRNVISGLINYVAGGGNLARVIPSLHEYAQVMGKKGLSALDDTHKYIKWTNGEVITKREAFIRFYAKRGQDLTNIESGINTGSAAKGVKVLKYAKEATPFINIPGAIKEQFEYAKYVGADKWGFKEVAGLTGDQLNNYIKTVFTPLAYGNSLVDGAIKWAWVQTRLDSADGVLGKMDDFGKRVTGGKTYSRDLDLFDDMDNFFVNGRTTGALQKGLAKYVVPFGQFAMASPPMAIRHAIRNPAQFQAYARLIRMNHRENMSDPDIRQSGFSEFELMGIPMTLFKDYNNPGQILTLFPTNVDMYSSSLAYVGKQVDRVRQLTTGESEIAVKNRKAVSDPYNLMDFVKENLTDNPNPVIQTFMEAYTGKDNLGRDIDKNKRPELGGATIDPNVFWLLSKVPGVSQFNRTFGGRGAITSANGGVEAQPVAGLFGTPNREATRTEEARYRAKEFMGSPSYTVFKDILGLDVRTIDLAEGRQHTLADVKRTIMTLDKQMGTVMKSPDSPEKQRKLDELKLAKFQLQVDAHRVGEWLRANKIPESKALNVLYQNGIGVRQLPYSNEYVDKLLKDIAPTTAP